MTPDYCYPLSRSISPLNPPLTCFFTCSQEGDRPGHPPGRMHRGREDGAGVRGACRHELQDHAVHNEHHRQQIEIEVPGGTQRGNGQPSSVCTCHEPRELIYI